MKTIISFVKLSVVVLFCQFLIADSPEWSVSPGDFEFTSTLTGLVSNEGVQMSGDGDILAAFDSNGQVRGIANQIVPPFGPYVGTTLYELQVYSNAGIEAYVTPAEAERQGLVSLTQE